MKSKKMAAKCAREGIACDAESCEGCGWDPEEETWRKALIQAGDMELGTDGRERLVLRK